MSAFPEIKPASAIGLDLGRNLGWALSIDGTLTSGVRVMPTFDGIMGEGMRFVQFGRFLAELFTRASDTGFPITSVFFEEVEFLANGSLFQPRLYFGFRARVLSLCASRNVRVVGIGVPTVKRHATGRGNADKNAMLRAAVAKWPLQKVTDDNQADALFVLDAGLSGVVSKPPAKKQHRAVIRAARKIQPELKLS